MLEYLVLYRLPGYPDEFLICLNSWLKVVLWFLSTGHKCVGFEVHRSYKGRLER